MALLTMIIFPILKMILLLSLPFLFIGVINKVKAKFAGKQGASIFQPYFDFNRLMNKGEVISETSTAIFRVAPVINLACLIVAAMLDTVIHFEGELILFSYLLALGKFVSVTAAMDTGSSFEGMGASREVSYTSLIEPAFFIIISSICAMNGVYSFASLAHLFWSNNDIMILIALATVFALFLIILIEGSRVPIDDPKTHLELTMIHEVMVLDNSGVDLAFIQYGAALKMMLFTTIITMTIAPLSFVGSVLVALAIAVLIGIIESLCARIRLTHIIEYTFTLIVAALIVMALVLLIMHGGHL